MKYLKYIGFASLLAGSLLIGSCTEELELSPTDALLDEDVLNSGDKVEKVLIGAYDALGRGSLFGGDVMRDSELLGSDGSLVFSGTYGDPADIWRKEITVTNFDVSSRWISSYFLINSANIILDKLELIDEEKQERIKGEALFLRGLTYFELAKFFGQPYSAGNAGTNPAVPIMTRPTYTANDITYPARASVEAVYAQAISDLQQAEALLPVSNGVYANKVAAAAVLSRIYLQMQDYAAARDAANRGLAAAAGKFSLMPAYEDAFNNTVNTVEDVLAVQVTTQDGVNNMQLYFAPSQFGGRGDIEIQDAHLALYQAQDERFALFYEDPSTEEIRTGKWVNQFGNVNVIRLAELYLTRAEANARLGTAVGATPAADVNKIRQRAGLPALLAPSVEDIVKERFLELAFEGQRIHDLKRLKMNVDGLPYNSPKLVFPVPQSERDTNKELTQNTGY